jgi:hypothetical protein
MSRAKINVIMNIDVKITCSKPPRVVEVFVLRRIGQTYPFREDFIEGLAGRVASVVFIASGFKRKEE